MKKFKVLSNVAFLVLTLVLILVGCSSTNEGDPNYTLELGHNGRIAGAEYHISYNPKELKFVSVNSEQDDVRVASATDGNKGNAKIVVMATDGETAGSLANVEFEAQSAGAEPATIDSVKTVDASPHSEISAQAIGISEVKLTPDMAKSMLGDADGDQAIGVSDAIAIGNIVAGGTATDLQKVLADVDGDDQLTAFDVDAVLKKAAFFNFAPLEALVRVKPALIRFAKDETEPKTLLVFNAGTGDGVGSLAAPSISVPGDGKATVNTENTVAGQSYAFGITPGTLSGAISIDAGAAGKKVVTIEVPSTTNPGGGGGGENERTAYYIDGGGAKQTIPQNEPSTSFAFYAWLEDEHRGVKPELIGGTEDIYDPATIARQEGDEREERAEPYTQNLAGAYVGYKKDGKVYPVVNAKVRWLIDDEDGFISPPPLVDVRDNNDTDCALNRSSCSIFGSIIFGSADDDEIDNRQADTWTNDKDGINVPFPTPSYNDNFQLRPSGPYPLINRTGVDNPNKNGFTWVALHSQNNSARGRIFVVATVNGVEVTKRSLIKEFRGTPKFVVKKEVKDIADRVVEPGEPVTFKIEITNTGTAPGTPLLRDRLRTDEVAQDPDWPFVDNVADVYRLVDLPYHDANDVANKTGLTRLRHLYDHYDHSKDTQTDADINRPGTAGSPRIAIFRFNSAGTLVEGYMDDVISPPRFPNPSDIAGLFGNKLNTNGTITPALQAAINRVNKPELSYTGFSSSVYRNIFVDQGHEQKNTNREFDEEGSDIDEPFTPTGGGAVVPAVDDDQPGINPTDPKDGIFSRDVNGNNNVNEPGDFDGFKVDYEGFNYQAPRLNPGDRLEIWVSAVANRDNDTYCNVVDIRGFVTDDNPAEDIEFTPADNLNDTACFEVSGPKVKVTKQFFDAEAGVWRDNFVTSRGKRVPARILIENTGATTAYDIVLDDDLYSVDGKQIKGTGASAIQVGDFPYEDENKDAGDVGTLNPDKGDNVFDINNEFYRVLDPDVVSATNTNPRFQRGVYRQLECDVRTSIDSATGPTTPTVDDPRILPTDPPTPPANCSNANWSTPASIAGEAARVDDDGIQDWVLNTPGGDNDLEAGEVIEYRFDIQITGDDTSGSVFCDYARAYFDLEETRNGDNRVSDGDEACLSIVNIEIDKVLKLTNGNVIKEGDKVSPGTTYYSDITITNKGGGTVNDVFITDLIGQGDVSNAFVVYETSSFNSLSGNPGVFTEATHLVTPKVVDSNATNKFQRFETFDIPAGGSIIVRVVSKIPDDYPADNVCDTAKYDTPLGISDTDSACVEVTSTAAVQTSMIDSDGDPFDAGTEFTYNSVVFAENDSNESLINNVVWFSFPRASANDGFVLRNTRVFLDNSPVIDPNTGSASCRAAGELQALTVNAALRGSPPASSGLDVSGSWQQLVIPGELAKGHALCFEHTVVNNNVGNKNPLLFYEGRGKNSGSVKTGISSEPTTIK